MVVKVVAVMLEEVMLEEVMLMVREAFEGILWNERRI